MALLYRMTRLRDRGDTHVFTFVVTRSATRDADRDVATKDFQCSHQRWAVAFSRHDTHLGVYLVWRGACEGMRVYVDFTFTLLSRDHFSANEGFSGKQVRFSSGAAAQGRGRCVSISELGARFADARGEFQLELCMSRVRTLYTCEVRVPASSAVPSPRSDTPPFAFAGFDWCLSLCGPGVRLQRLSGGEVRCRVRYALALGESERRTNSGPLDHICDGEGRGPLWTPPPPDGGTRSHTHACRPHLHQYAHKGGVRATVELVSARVVVEVCVPLNGARAAHCYDRDKQAWAVRCDTHSETVRFQMLYRDVHNVPRNHLRYVTWSAWLVSPKGGDADADIGPGAGAESDAHAQSLPGAPFAHYYAQESVDEGLIMETTLPVAEVARSGCRFLDAGGELHVRLEWGECHLLFQATYHIYDDLCRLHAHQMRREISALQAENYALERQLFSYQKSLAYAQAQGAEGAEGAEDDDDLGRLGLPPLPLPPAPGRRSPAERSLSTDTEYA